MGRLRYKPKLLLIESDMRCNAPCGNICFQFEDKSKDFRIGKGNFKTGKDNLCPLELEHVLKDAKEFGIAMVGLTGGEPTFDFKRYRWFVDTINRVGDIPTMLFTNGRYATSVKKAKAYHKGLNSIQLSVNKWLFEYNPNSLDKAKKQSKKAANVIIAAYEEGITTYIHAIFADLKALNPLFRLISKEIGSRKDYDIGVYGDMLVIQKSGGDIRRITFDGVSTKPAGSFEGICENTLSDNLQAFVYGPLGIHPCCKLCYPDVLLMSRYDVLSVIGTQNIFEVASRIANNATWKERFNEGCNFCIKSCKTEMKEAGK